MKKFVFLMAILLVMGSFIGCSNGTSPKTTYTYSSIVPAITSLSAGLVAATLNGNTPSDSAYYVTSGSGGTAYFNGYYYSPYTLTGSLAQVTGVSESGTINFSGGVVTKMVYAGVAASAGTITVTFSNGAVYIQNNANDTFTLQ
jgi:hypothetical protein